MYLTEWKIQSIALFCRFVPSPEALPELIKIAGVDITKAKT
jgi:hypothetical protein